MLTSNSYGLMMTVNGMKESGSYLGVVLVTATNFIASVSAEQKALSMSTSVFLVFSLLEEKH
jgi:cell division protein FtsW (lipid II flippase)